MTESKLSEPRSQYDAIRRRYEGPIPPWDWPTIRTGPFKNRKRGLGSADAVVIANRSPYQSPLGLYYVIRGEIEKPPVAFKDIAEVGLLLEPVIAELYRRKTKRKLIDRALYEDNGGRWDVRGHPKFPWILANLDLECELGQGLNLPFEARGSGVLEFKSKDAWGTYFDEHGNPTEDVMIQVQHQLLVTGFEWASICFLVGRRFYYVDVRAHEKFQRWLMGELAEFWERCWNGDPPPVDAQKATTDALQSKFPVQTKGEMIELSSSVSKLVPRYHFLDDVMSDAKKEREEIGNRIRFEMAKAEECRTVDKKFGFTLKKDKDADGKYIIKGILSEEEKALAEGLGAEFQPGRKGTRKLKKKKIKK